MNTHLNGFMFSKVHSAGSNPEKRIAIGNNIFKTDQTFTRRYKYDKKAFEINFIFLEAL